MYYSPVLKNNKVMPLPWQIKTFFINMTWPLVDNPKPWIRCLNLCLLSAELLAVTFVIQGGIRFIIKYHNDINLSIEASATIMVLFECSLRISHMAFKKSSFKLYLQLFYSTIYFEDKENPEICRKIKQSLLPTRIFSYGYILTLVSFLTMPILNAIVDKKTVLPCNIIIDYDLENSVNYNLTVLLLTLVAVCFSFFFIGEAFLWANCILHLNARYIILQDEIKRCGSRLIDTVAPCRLAFDFRQNILRMFIKACNLNRFTVLLDGAYNFRIFVTICFSSLMVCVLCFQISETGHSSKSFGYISWLMAKISELIIFGNLGSTISDTTDKLSSMYYMSNWEEIIYRSTDTKQNILLLKHLQIAMSLHRKPIQMTGLKFVLVSLDTIVKVLRVSGSYFAFLYTIKQRSMN